MKSKPRHPHANRIAKIVRGHWMTIPDAKERVRVVANKAMKAFAPPYRHPLHAKILDTLIARNVPWEAYRLVSDVLDATDWDAFAKPETIPKGA